MMTSALVEDFRFEYDTHRVQSEPHNASKPIL